MSDTVESVWKMSEPARWPTNVFGFAGKVFRAVPVPRI
jgi:hypothetical protein